MARFGQDKPPVDEGMVDEEDFYGEGANSPTATKDALPGAVQDASAMNTTVSFNKMPALNIGSGATLSAPTAEQRKLENQKKAEQLRAKLIANRQNTPIRANTPNKITPKSEQPQENTMKKKAEDAAAPNGDHVEQQSEPSSDIFGIEALLQEGKAAAEAKAKAEDSAKPEPALITPQPLRPAEPQRATTEQQSERPKDTTEMQQPEKPNSVTDSATKYYTDLGIWLELTGYHDIDYRNSKLRTYKERKALEEEAARIQEKLEKLRQTEQAEMEALRSGSVHPVAAPNRLPPALPTAMPVAEVAKPFGNKPIANGTKRAHSPDPVLADKNPRHREDANNGIRIRGVNDSPQGRHFRGRAASPIDRRISYPDARPQSSFAESKGRLSRDPSLERRQAYYGRADEGYRGQAQSESFMADGRARGRSGFSSVNVPHEMSYHDPYPATPRGIRDVDTGRGANVRYFMIKSWNADNVAAAMRESLWSTQEKNEQLLAEAYHTSRAVVLCFSVNNSKAFQGYALMTSPPDPALPKPAFCAKLNWPTSPAFRLTWLATTAVHFRHVGHIKNEFNLDDAGHPCAVLVGKDGQEIAPEAGRGLCEILDEVQSAVDAQGADGRSGGGRGGGKGRAW